MNVKALAKSTPYLSVRIKQNLLTEQGFCRILVIGGSAAMIGAGAFYGYVFPIFLGIVYGVCGLVLSRLK